MQCLLYCACSSNAESLLCPAVGVCKSVPGSCCSDMQCGPAGWQHWFLSVHVFAGILHIPAGHCCHCDSMGDKHNSKMDSRAGSISLVFMGISPLHCRVSVSIQKGAGCLPIVAPVHFHGVASFDKVTTTYMCPHGLIALSHYLAGEHPPGTHAQLCRRHK